jgi:thymidylate synthase ThyX
MSESNSKSNHPATESGNGTEVYAVHGAEPEVQAYAMAKYSRSALSMRESLQEINHQKAEKFLNTFYFQYGHRSIADLAHIAFAIEKLSMIAAIILVDEQRWDGQERSTRYQDFQKSGYHTPDFGGHNEAETAGLYRQSIEFLFREYQDISQELFHWLRDRTAQPADMKSETYERTLRARAFDLSRYLLPLATNTSLGQIVNARTLESQVSRLLSSEYVEVRKLGALLKQAASQPAYDVNHESFGELARQIRERDGELGDLADKLLLKPVRVSPTLVKYADRSDYETSSRKDLQQAAAQIMRGAPLARVRSVELEDESPLEIELASTLLYQHCHYSYRQIRQQVEDLSPAERAEVIELGAKHRGKHDELARAFSSGQRFCFDILMDVGGFRDMHRHRRCIQIGQDFTAAHGFDSPPEMAEAGLQQRYERAMQRASSAAADLERAAGHERAVYVLPMAYRKRTLFKMDFAQALYIAELRTTPAGHPSYRNVAYSMYEEVAKKYPALAKYFRVTDVRQPVDLLKR